MHHNAHFELVRSDQKSIVHLLSNKAVFEAVRSIDVQ